MDNQFEIQQKNQKSGKGLIVLVIILVLLVLGLGGYIVYDKMLTKESIGTKEPETEEKKVEEKENLDEIADILVSKLSKYHVTYYDDKEKVVFADLSDNDKMLGIYFNLNVSESFTKALVDDYFNNLFGVELSNYPDLNCWNKDGLLYKYNASTGEYEKQQNHPGHGGQEGHNDAGIIKYNNIEKVDGKYVITVTKVFWPNLRDSDGYYYADYNYSTKIDGLNNFVKYNDAIKQNEEVSDSDKEAVKKYYDENYEQFKNIKPQYKYTFTKSNNDYYLVKYEFIN